MKKAAAIPARLPVATTFVVVMMLSTHVATAVASHAGNAAKDVTRAVKIAGDGEEGTQATLLWILITFIYKSNLCINLHICNLHNNMYTCSYISVFINCYILYSSAVQLSTAVISYI